MKNFIQKSFSIHIKIMRFVGLYPPDTFSYFFTARSYIMYLLCIVMVTTLMFLFVLLDNNLDATQLNYTFIYQGETASMAVKLLPFITKGYDIKECINFFGNEFFEPKSKSEKFITANAVKISRIMVKMYLVGVFFGEYCWIFKPFLEERPYSLPLDVWLPYKTSNNFVFIITYIFLAISINYVSMAGTMIDPLIGSLAYQATCQLKILKHNLMNLQTDINVDSDVEKQKILYCKIKHNILHYNKILKFVSRYENCFSLSIFSQFCGSLISICFCILQLRQTNLASFNAVSIYVFIGVILGQIFFYCYFGTLLFQENNTLNDAIYLSRWYEYDVKCQKALIILMERSKRPMVVTAGKISTVTIATFMEIIKKIYSLVALIQNFQN